MSLFDRINTKIITEKKEPISDKEKYYRDRISKKAKDLGYKSSADLERTVDRGIKAVDKKPGGRYPRKGYATGEPFQADDNPATLKPKPIKQANYPGEKIPGTGKYEASGKSTLRGRFRYPSMDKDFSKAVKTGEVERDVAKRLKTRLKYTAGTELGGDKGVDNFVSKVMKNQKGTIGTGKGKDSDLYKILKRDIDNRNPTVPSKVINPKTGTRFRKPMPGGFDAEGGRTGTVAQQKRYDMTAQRKAAKFDKEIVKQANLPKGLKIPKGGEFNKDPKTGEMKPSSELRPKELNVKFKAAKLKLDYGGRMAEKDPMYKALTDAQKKKRYESIKKTIYNKKSSQPSKAPLKFSTYKYARNKIVPTNLKGKDQPKFKDIRNTIPYKSTTKDKLKFNKKDFATFSNTTKFGRLRKPSEGVKYKKTFKGVAGNLVKKGGKYLKNLPMKNKLGLAALGTVAAIAAVKKFSAPPKDTLTARDFKKSKSPVTKKDGSEVRRSLFLSTKQEKNNKEPRISGDRLTRNKNFTAKLKSGEYRTP